MEIRRLIVWVETQAPGICFRHRRTSTAGRIATQSIMQLRLLGCEANRLLEFRDGVVSFILQAQCASERLMSLPLLGCQLHGDAKLSNGVVESAFGFERLRQVGMGNGQRGPKFDQSAKVNDGSIQFVLLQQHLPQHVLGVSIARVEFYRFLKGIASRRQVTAVHCGDAGLVCCGCSARRLRLRRGQCNAADDTQKNVPNWSRDRETHQIHLQRLRQLFASSTIPEISSCHLNLPTLFCLQPVPSN